MKRRRLLASILAGATATAATGCLEPVEEELLGVDAPEYTNWIPASITDDGVLEYTYYDVSQMSKEEGINPEGFSTISRYSEMDSVSIRDIQTAVSVQTEEGSVRTVLTGGFEDEEVVAELENEGFTQTGEKDVFRILGNEEDGRYFGVSVGALVESQSGVDGLESTIDAENGETSRLVEDNEDFKTLVNELETGTVVSGRLTDEGRFGENANGRRFVVSGDTTEVLRVYIFEDAVDADNTEEEIRRELEKSEIRDMSVEFELSVVRVTGEVGTGSLQG